MQRIAGGSFRMGSERFYSEEQPTRYVSVETFWIDVVPVTNREFAGFVAATGYHTLAERALEPSQYPDADAASLAAASMVFTPLSHPVDMQDHRQWWRLVPGADWRHPLGPGSSINALAAHPVVHVGWQDAAAFAAWAGKRLPTEAEWEFAARGGLVAAEYAWGDDAAPDGRHMANFWRGEFPHRREQDDGFSRTSPVGFYPANGYGLYDMIGNVWEWTADWYALDDYAAGTKPCCAIADPRGGDEARSRAANGMGPGRKVVKGGSHLCADNYCRRYRPAARQAQAVDSTTSHIGFRCARDA